MLRRLLAHLATLWSLLTLRERLLLGLMLIGFGYAYWTI